VSTLEFDVLFGIALAVLAYVLGYRHGTNDERYHG
jgi:hypothetical protein